MWVLGCKQLFLLTVADRWQGISLRHQCLSAVASLIPHLLTLIIHDQESDPSGLDTLPTQMFTWFCTDQVLCGALMGPSKLDFWFHY